MQSHPSPSGKYCKICTDSQFKKSSAFCCRYLLSLVEIGAQTCPQNDILFALGSYIFKNKSTSSGKGERKKNWMLLNQVAYLFISMYCIVFLSYFTLSSLYCFVDTNDFQAPHFDEILWSLGLIHVSFVLSSINNKQFQSALLSKKLSEVCNQHNT